MKLLRELRIAFRGFLLMETSAFQNSKFELHLKEITDGRRLIKSVYQNGILKDCDFETESDIIIQFVEKFASIFKGNPRKNNEGDYMKKNRGTADDEAFRYFRHRKFLKKLRKLINIKHDLRACHRLIRLIRKRHIHERSANMKNEMKSFSDILRKLKTKFRTELQNGSNTTNSDKQQSETQLKNKTKMKVKTKSGKLARSKRSSLFNRFLMYPGTKWCGRGQTALHFNDLGTDREADVCCRDHDLCPHIIEEF
ncbi:hypothetical protein KUTeg_009838 [Tegillarca granosa]|uniref:Phospholipase A2-like central domain-containing protein n=1 Tax=Tegillarca granosa TaxID=220873 RepID=A0ABQ9FA29_TEGGR|nr:hypothetical protein KUTeg_009838 [Tegillarca granosa]